MSDNDEPAVDGRRPPFERANVLAVRHGALSARLITDDAQRMLAELRAAGAPWLEDIDGVLLDGWLYALAACRRLRGWLDEHGLLDDEGQPRAAAGLWLRLERRLDQATHALGFDPIARAGLARDSAVARHLSADVVAETARAGRELRAAEDAAGVADVWLLAAVACMLVYAAVAIVVLIGRVS